MTKIQINAEFDPDKNDDLAEEYGPRGLLEELGKLNSCYLSEIEILVGSEIED